MNPHDSIRKIVSETYAEALNRPVERGCCSKGQLVQLAPYDRGGLQALPAEAVVNAFGCGNPLAYGGVVEGDVVVDLGCGAGLDVILAARKVGPGGRVIGIDMTEAMVAKARANIAEAGLTNAEVRTGIIESLPLESNSADWVISNCVINLSPEKPRVFAEIVRALKPGGKVLVSDLVVEDLPPWARSSAGLYCSCVAGAISEREYITGLRGAGLENIEVTERQVYEAQHLKGLLQSELHTRELRGEADASHPRDLDDLLESLSGKVCSVTFVASKPTAQSGRSETT